MPNPVRPVVLEADPGPSSPVNDRIPKFRSSGEFSGGKEKVKKSFFLKKHFRRFFFSNFFCMICAIIVAMKIKCCYPNYCVLCI